MGSGPFDGGFPGGRDARAGTELDALDRSRGDALLLLGYCSMNKRSEPLATAPAPAAVEPAAPAAPAPAEAPPAAAPEVEAPAPEGAAVVAGMANGSPTLKVYFDVGKTAVSNEFKEKSAALIEHMNANPGEKAVISGFNDPTGDAVVNARLVQGPRRSGAAEACCRWDREGPYPARKAGRDDRHRGDQCGVAACGCHAALTAGDFTKT
jgi:outer membrane protein OmpA-like peptidoglycan-associated protein